MKGRVAAPEALRGPERMGLHLLVRLALSQAGFARTSGPVLVPAKLEFPTTWVWALKPDLSGKGPFPIPCPQAVRGVPGRAPKGFPAVQGTTKGKRGRTAKV